MQQKKDMKCKGKRDGEACGNVICQTDGEYIYLELATGGVTAIKPRKKDSVISIRCENCGFNNDWGAYKQ